MHQNLKVKPTTSIALALHIGCPGLHMFVVLATIGHSTSAVHRIVNCLMRTIWPSRLPDCKISWVLATVHAVQPEDAPLPLASRIHQVESPAQLANPDAAKLVKALEKLQGEVERLDGYMKASAITYRSLCIKTPLSGKGPLMCLVSHNISRQSIRLASSFTSPSTILSTMYAACGSSFSSPGFFLPAC